MKKVIVGFSHSYNIFGKIIRWATSSKVNHVFIMFEEDGVDIVFQASGLAVNYVNYSRFLDHSKILETYSLWMTDEEWTKCKHDQLLKLGTPYSWRDIVGFIWVLLNRKFDRDVENPLSDGDYAYICVDLTAEQLGYEWESTMTPEDMRRWCQLNPRLTREI